MKCKYCGGNLSLEEEKCPYCGQINDQAQKHIKDMKLYRRAFENTRRGVHESTHKFTGATVRIVVIAVMVVAIVVTMILGAKAYDLRRMWIQHRAERNAEEYMAVLERYLEEEEFLAFAAFCNENYIYTYDCVFEKYAQVERVCQNYTYVYTSMMELACPPEYREQEEVLEYLVENLEYFYESLDGENYRYYEGVDNEINRKALAAMEEKVILMLQTYGGLSKEEAEQFGELTKARRAVMLEDAANDVE